MDKVNTVPRRLASILLLISFSALGSGWLSHVHAQAHAIEDAALAHVHEGHGGHHHHDHPSAPRHSHDESNCDLHAMLRAPVTSLNAAPVLDLAGRIVERLSLSSESLVSQRTLARIDCRGPPSF